MYITHNHYTTDTMDALPIFLLHLCLLFVLTNTEYVSHEFFNERFMAVNEKLESLQRSVQDLQEENKRLAAQCGTVSHGFKDLSKDKRLLMLPTETTVEPDVQAVAFSASMSASFSSSIGLHHHFIYDSVETNVGNHYNNYTGTFTAPSKGVYVFAWTIETQGNRGTGSVHDGEIITELIRNGSVLGTLHADSEQAWDDDSATGIEVLELNPGDVVYVRSGAMFMTGDFVSGSHGGWTFSGWKI